MIRHTEIPFQKQPDLPSASSPQNCNERKIYLVKGKTMIPVTPTDAKDMKPIRLIVPGTIKPINKVSPSPPKVHEPVKEIKLEPLDEETASAVANITEAKPINLEELLKKKQHISNSNSIDSRLNMPIMFADVKKEHPNDLVLHLKSKKEHVPQIPIKREQFSPIDENPSTSTRTVRRNRRPTKHGDFVYDSTLYEEEKQVREPTKKRQRVAEPSNGCRCEYVVPELEKKMDRILEKMQFIESLAKTMLGREQEREENQKAQLAAAQDEIKLLKRQLIIQRNQKLINTDHYHDNIL
ncbi:unnamed protein product [Caenorhabditis sp. 36 PRJEB53466]|nr:unnamed protein product [Caenorhabditis sp. 36 PRJEB53466]